MSEPTQEERAIIDTVRRFVDRDVRPVARDLEHSDTYPAELIDHMREVGARSVVGSQAS